MQKLTAQTTSDSVINYGNHNLTHLYYDEQYFLVDKDCKFKHYYRILEHPLKANKFEGFFTDYYNNNKPANSGTYKNGRKNGVFKTFYYNGNLKSEVNFIDDKLVDTARYFYDNAKPWMVLVHKNAKVFIQDYWNPFGEQKVKLGKGYFEFKDYTWGYNESGYDSFSYEGRVKNGLPAGSWYISTSYPNNTKEIVHTEKFINGEFVSSYNYIAPYHAGRKSVLKFHPPYQIDNALKFTSKKCNIDDNQEFTGYLETIINKNYDFSIHQRGLIAPIVTKVAVNKFGNSTGVEILEGKDIVNVNELTILLKYIKYWIPSFVDNKTVNDTLTVKFILNTQNPEKRFQDFSITREQEMKN